MVAFLVKARVIALLCAGSLFPFSSAFSETKNKGLLKLGVRDAEAIALRNSPDIKILREQRRIRDLLYRERWRDYFPTATITYNRSTSITRNADDTRTKSVNLNVEQVIYDGGRRSLALKSARNDYKLGRFDYQLGITDLRFQVRQAFYNILSARAQLSTLLKSIERQKEQLKFARAEKRLGESTELEVLEIENRVNQILLQERTARITLRGNLDQLKLLLRVNSETPVSLKGDILKSVQFKYKKLREKKYVAIALDRRVEFKRSHAAEIQSLTEYRIAKSFYIPTFSVGGFYGFTGDRFPPRQREYGFNFRISMLLGPNTVQDSSNASVRDQGTSRSLTSATSLSLFDRMDYRRTILSTGVQAVRARTERRQLPDRIRIEVRNALNNYRTSWDALQLADRNIVLFEKRLKIASQRVGLGDSRRTDFAETEIRWLEAVNQQIAARVRYMTAVAQLEIAAGIELDSLKLIRLD